MAWRIGWSTGASLFMSRLEQKEAKRISEKLEEAAKNPQHFFERLVGEEDYKLRVGDYRVVVLLLHEQNMIFVEKVGHRKNIYK